MIHAAENLGIQLVLPTLPPLATSELAPELKCTEGTLISNRPRSQNGGKRDYDSDVTFNQQKRYKKLFILRLNSRC